MIKNMTEGSPTRLIIGFAIPMLLGMLFQQLYNMVDTMIVGQFLGTQALAGVGSTGSINFLVLGFCIGICNGFAIPVAQEFGARKYDELRRYVANGAWLCILFSTVLTVGVCIFCRRILELMGTPEDIMEYAHTYIFIIFLGIPAMILYNITAAIIRSLGDSKTPVVFLAISSVLNIGLDLLLILVIPMGVAGAAIATVTAQGISGVVCLLYMRKRFDLLRFQPGETALRSRYVSRLCGIGVPMGLQYSITAIGSVVIQSAVNSFGSTVVAGVTAAQKLNQLISCPVESLGQTMAPYTGQNVGAGKLDRVQKGLISASVSGFVCSGVLLVITLLFGRNLCLLFLKPEETEAMEYAYRFLRITASGYCLLTLVNTVRFSIQGMGFSVLAITAGALEMAARTLAGLVIVPAVGFLGVCLGHPLAWLFADVFLIPAFILCKKKLERQALADS